MKMHAPLTDMDGEVREITNADMARFRPAHEVLPESRQATLGIRRCRCGPVVHPTPPYNLRHPVTIWEEKR